MAKTTAGLTNINLLSESQYDAQTNPAPDELWAINIESDTNFKQTVVGWGMPDYDAGITISANVNTTFAKNGYVSYIPGTGVTDAGAWNSCIIKINGNTVLSQSFYATKNGTNADAFMCPVGAGDTILVTAKTIGSVIFYPSKGEN